MRIDKYQKWTKTTAIYPKDQALSYLMLGLTEEAGEVAGKYKKFLRDGTSHSDLQKAVVKELGDVMWYAARIADELNVPMSMVLEGNMIKLTKRVETDTVGGSGDDREEQLHTPKPTQYDFNMERERVDSIEYQFGNKLAHIERCLKNAGPRVQEMQFVASITTGINNVAEAQRSSIGRCKELGHTVISQTDDIDGNSVVVKTTIAVPVEQWKKLKMDESFLTHWVFDSLV